MEKLKEEIERISKSWNRFKSDKELSNSSLFKLVESLK
jgi:hypothetical protein